MVCDNEEVEIPLKRKRFVNSVKYEGIRILFSKFVLEGSVTGGVYKLWNSTLFDDTTTP